MASTPKESPPHNHTRVDMMNSKPTLIINVYKPCDKNTIPELHKHVQKSLNFQDYGTVIIAGDFNTHHPLWNPEGYESHDRGCGYIG